MEKLTIDLVINKFYGDYPFSIELIKLPFECYTSEHPVLAVHHGIQLVKSDDYSYSLTRSNYTSWNVVHINTGMLVCAGFKTRKSAIAFTGVLLASDFDPFSPETGELLPRDEQHENLRVLLKDLINKCAGVVVRN